jgi:hypothetical protein
MRGRMRHGIGSLGMGIALLTAACGVSSGGSADGGAVALNAVWEGTGTGGGADFEGSADLPPAVQTVEVRIEADGSTIRELVDPQATRSVVVSGVPPGSAFVSVLGYDVRLLGPIDLAQVDVAPSYASGAVEVEVVVGRTTNAGVIEVLAQPFVTDFSPLPGAQQVETATDVEFLLAIGVGGIDVASVDIEIDGALVVAGGTPGSGATLEPCEDGGENPCGSVDRDLNGLRFRAPIDLPPGKAVGVRVLANGGPDFTRSLDYEYEFYTVGFPQPARARLRRVGAESRGCG